MSEVSENAASIGPSNTNSAAITPRKACSFWMRALSVTRGMPNTGLRFSVSCTSVIGSWLRYQPLTE